MRIYISFLLLTLSSELNAQLLFYSARPTSEKKTTVVHLLVLGQSQAGGYNNAPALTTTGEDGVRTLTDGPVDVNTSGSLISLVEGDNSAGTLGGSPAATTNVETVATSMCRQLNTWYGEDIDYVATVHALGGTTIQELGKGGSTGLYEEMLDAIAQVKTLVEAEGKIYNCHLVWLHGGTGGTTYEASVEDLYSDFLADVKPTYTNQAEVYMFNHQQRIVGSPDYGIAQYNASVDVGNIVLVGSEIPLNFSDFTSVGVAYQGDAVHWTNHATRYIGLLCARAIYRTLSTGVEYKPLELDVANTSVSGTNKIVIPILNEQGTLSLNGNGGIEVYSNTTSAVLASTCAIVSGNLEITCTGNPIGQHSLTIRTGRHSVGYIRDNSSDTDIPSFNDSGANPYDLDKFLVRADYSATAFFPVNYTLNFGGDGADPAVSGTYSIWDTSESTSNETYTLQTGLTVVAVNTASNYWGFEAGGVDDKSGVQTLTGTNYYNNTILQSFWFVENRSAGIRLTGLNPLKFYTIRLAGLRTGSATLRETIYTIGVSSITKTSNRSGTASVYTTDAENAIFTDIAPNGSGEILITIEDNSTQFGYLNVLQITEQ